MQTWNDITRAVEQALKGRNPDARAALERCWGRTELTDAAQRCVISHYLADQQQTLEEEMAWDERALVEFPGIADDDLADIGVPSAAGFEPSLRLNLGDAYLRAGRVDDARTQLDHARASAHHLPTEGYGAMIRGGIQRLAHQLEG